nr:hypothetical protein [Tanacetum cinerariifolium]
NSSDFVAGIVSRCSSPILRELSGSSVDKLDPSTGSNIKTIDPILEKFTDEPDLDYLPPPGEDDDDDNDLFDLKSDNDE